MKKQFPFGEKIRIKVDARDRKPADKFWEWTKKGAPIICEVGMRDVESQKIMVKERIKLGTDEGKQIVDVNEFCQNISSRLKGLQKQMFNKAKARLEANIRTDIKTPEDFRRYFAESNVWIEDGKQGKVAFVRGKWCGDDATESLLKEMKITIRCIPFDQTNTQGVCLLTGKPATMDVIYARSY